MIVKLGTVMLLLVMPELAAAMTTNEETVEEIIVTSHWRPLASTSPAAVTILHGDDIRRSGKTSLAAVLRTVAGVDVARTGGYGSQTSIFIRGAESDHTLVLLDGVPLNNPRTGAVDAAFIDIADVARIEIIRGPQATIQGAPGGVIHIFSKTAAGSSASVQVESHGYRLAAVAAKRVQPLQLYAHVLNHYGDGISAAATGSERDGFRVQSLRAGTVLHAEQALFRYDLQWLEANSDLDDFTTVVVDDPDYQRRRKQLQMSWLLQFQTELLQQQLRVTHHTIREQFRNGPAAADSFSDNRTLDLYGNDTIWSWSAVRQQQWSQVRAASLHGGVELRHTKGRESAFVDSVFTQALWMQQEVDTGAVVLSGGSRLQRHPDYGLHHDFYLGIAVPVAAWVVNASYGTGYRTPSILELAHPLSGNPDLSPERSRSMTLGLSYSSDYWQWSLANFVTRAGERIDYDFASMRLSNTGRASISGIEFAGTAFWPEHDITLHFNATRTVPTDSASDRRLLRRSRYKWQLQLQHAVGDWSMLGSVRYTGNREDITGTLPSHVVTDANISWQISPQLVYSLRIDNIFNRSYQEVDGYGTPGRELFVAVRWSPAAPAASPLSGNMAR